MRVGGGAEVSGKLVDVSPYDYLRDATYAALKNEPILLPGDRDHGLV